jgi:hypothetical protein
MPAMLEMRSAPASSGLPDAVVTVALCAILGVFGAGCSDTNRYTGTTPPTASVDGTTAGSTSTPDEEKRMRIEITIGDQHFRATLSESAAARDLLTQLPLTIDLVDHGAVEKTGPLPSPLSLDGQPDGADPDVGDVGYYAPGNDLVLYYGNQSYYPGIVILGQLEGDAAQRISDLDGPVTTTVEAHGA